MDRSYYAKINAALVFINKQGKIQLTEACNQISKGKKEPFQHFQNDENGNRQVKSIKPKTIENLLDFCIDIKLIEKKTDDYVRLTNYGKDAIKLYDNILGQCIVNFIHRRGVNLTEIIKKLKTQKIPNSENLFKKLKPKKLEKETFNKCMILLSKTKRIRAKMTKIYEPPKGD